MDYTNLQSLLNNKRVLIATGGIILILLLLVMVLSLATKKDEPSSIRDVRDVKQKLGQKQPTVTSQAQLIPSSTISAEMQIAIDEAKQSAQEYDNWQAGLRTDYPWLRKLPLAGKKYFVYYDLNKQVFIGRLYPGAGDDVASIKAEISRQLKEDKNIPVENFMFQWMINPK